MKHTTFLGLTALIMCSTALVHAAKDTEKSQTIKLQSTIVGDKEQPGVSYFVPWQDPSAPDQMQPGLGEQYDDSLNAIDRETMERSMRLYNEMNLENSANDLD